MPTDGDSFLPRILSVFYAVFDNKNGPKIVYQVPEGLVAAPMPNAVLPSVPPTPTAEATPITQPPRLHSRTSSNSLVSPSDLRTSRSLQSPHKRPSSANRALFNFSDVSSSVIPPSALCGRLVVCSTGRHRVIGFPAELPSAKYERNYFRFNLCFVFDRGADLSCYEPVVRKVNRVLTACEEESDFLSCPKTSPQLHAILEQLYEDLNSYSETSIRIDSFNSIELKIFPFYPNPPTVKDWMVPVALINITKQIEDNWDLTMVKICQHIDGTNHVRRIARLADCDISYTRMAIAHLLYYQVIMTIDIFQYSNMYTLSKSIQWLADQPHVKEECGLYVTKPDRPIPDWPKLLHLYSRMKPGRTVYEWMECYSVDKLGIDVRRFTSFGVIKGFLRRVHRWPILITPESTDNAQPSALKRTKSRLVSAQPPQQEALSSQNLLRGRSSYTAPINASVSPDNATSAPPTPRMIIGARPRRASAAEKVLEQVRIRDQHTTTLSSSPRTSWIHQPSDSPTNNAPGIFATSSTPQDSSPSSSKFGSVESRRLSAILFPTSPVSGSGVLAPKRPRLSRSPSAPALQQQSQPVDPVEKPALPSPYPTQLPALLDGEHHTDELAVMFDAGWPRIEQWMDIIVADGTNGRICMIYR